jgi:hypothetical protein
MHRSRRKPAKLSAFRRKRTLRHLDDDDLDEIIALCGTDQDSQETPAK